MKPAKNQILQISRTTFLASLAAGLAAVGMVLCGNATQAQPLQIAGDLIAELRSADLVAKVKVWTNRSGSGNSVGNFTNTGDKAFVVSNATSGANLPLWNGTSVKTVYVDNTPARALFSAGQTPAEINGNNPVTMEAWVYNTTTSASIQFLLSYGLGGGAGAQAEEREFGYGTASYGGFTGDFGGADTAWSTAPTVGWHYLAVTYDGTTVKLYQDGVANGVGGGGLDTIQTRLEVGQSDPGIVDTGGDNPFFGYIASARVMSGVLTAGQIANNFAAGLLAVVPVTVFAPTLSPTNTQITQGNSATLTGSFTTNASYTYTYQWLSNFNGGSFSAISGATSLTYPFNTTGFTPGTYAYELALTNFTYAIGAVSSAFAITVDPSTPPTLVRDTTPASINSYVTANNTLPAGFIGVAPLTFQWQVSTDDINWAGTGVFTTNITIESEVPLTNWYRLQAINPLGTNTSSPGRSDPARRAAVAALYAPQTAGDLIVNLQQIDLAAGVASDTWSNVTSDANSVGNFSGALIGGSALNVTTGAPYFYNRVNSLFVNGQVANGLQSALLAPTEIVNNSPVSAEAWVYAIAVNQPNSTAIAYGNQAQDSPPQTDREFNYCIAGGGATSGDFGDFDTTWATTPAPGAWHYLAWTYDGANLNLYLDGVLDKGPVAVATPNATPDTVICVGGAIGQQSTGNPNLSIDIFQGYIGAARLESGVLTAAQIAHNFTAGLMGVVPVTLWALSVTPVPLNDIVYQGSTVTLGLVDRETTSFTYQWITDNGSGGANWTDASGSSTGTNYVLDVSSLAAGTTYQYAIVLSNSAYALSFTSAPAGFFVIGPPIVQQQPTPASASVFVGQNVTFTASFSTSETPLTNQWQFSPDGITYGNIPGANSTTLTLTNVQLTNTGNYVLAASNPAGQGAPSAPATLTVMAALLPVITWTNPVPIIYGTTLSSNQLDATANVPGSFAYTPTNGTVLNAGTNTLSGAFTPTDTNDYQSVTNTVSIVVLAATPLVTWNNPLPFDYGLPLGPNQLARIFP